MKMAISYDKYKAFPYSGSHLAPLSSCTPLSACHVILSF